MWKAHPLFPKRTRWRGQLQPTVSLLATVTPDGSSTRLVGYLCFAKLSQIFARFFETPGSCAPVSPQSLAVSIDQISVADSENMPRTSIHPHVRDNNNLGPVCTLPVL